MLSKSLTLRGYINYEFAASTTQRSCARSVLLSPMGASAIARDITEGLENAPAAFIGMLQGRNFGKAVVRTAPA
jgi:NADPH-dependent curcumin reductase CurA